MWAHHVTELLSHVLSYGCMNEMKLICQIHVDIPHPLILRLSDLRLALAAQSNIYDKRRIRSEHPC